MSSHIYDVAIIGGGINGCGIARDAAGRGLKTILFEKGDLAQGTSSASTKLIHGGLRYLEHYEFRLVREALIEREVLLGIAPHVIWPLRFVLPHHQGLRPAWLLRLGLFLYDHLGGRKILPGTKTLDLKRAPAGEPLRQDYALGFEYSDCWVEDSRLVVLNAKDAAEHGADIHVRTAVTSAKRDHDRWTIETRTEQGNTQSYQARQLINAAGPWVADTLNGTLRMNSAAKVRQVKGSHIVVPKLYDHDRCYIFQNEDGRIIFAIPYEHDFTLIGTTDIDYHDDPSHVRISDDEIAYLCAAASEYFKTPITRESIVWTYSGVRPLYDDGASKAQEATRDYVLVLDAPHGQAPLLSVFGGKITTYRRLAEAALDKLNIDAKRKGWTGQAALPGGDFPVDGFSATVERLRTRAPFLPASTAARYVRAYGQRADRIVANAKTLDDLGRRFGADLHEAEVDYLIHEEWARSAEDILWRRSKLGLRFDASETAKLRDHVAQRLAQTA
ncbi:glycerol-3-phosphate dehydrogenase [Rhizobiales bacterium TNE-4]|nr:glycerol-3-phosphate dehydrogenase [Rhizobiales bacterium TNE-4]MBV1828018.1 glycerol-3-phosphate dehydrogenase [Rhizobiales bacterium TNE-4]